MPVVLVLQSKEAPQAFFWGEQWCLIGSSRALCLPVRRLQRTRSLRCRIKLVLVRLHLLLLPHWLISNVYQQTRERLSGPHHSQSPHASNLMNSCKYYRVEQQPQSRDIQPSWRQSKGGFVFIPYCAHSSGEFCLSNVRFWPDAANRLKCQGNPEKCQLENGFPESPPSP